MTAIRVETVIASSWSCVTIDEGQAEALLDVDQLELGALAQLLVERAQRLVEQQHLGALDDRAGQRHALLLAARELVRAALLAPSSCTSRRPRPPGRGSRSWAAGPA